MEEGTGKALDRAALNLKRKQAARIRDEPSFTERTNRVVKKMRLGGSERKLTSVGSGTGRSLVRCYLNYKKSGRPERLMFYKNGDWLDYPKDVVALVKKDFEIKKAAVEVELNGDDILLDFLHMYQVDLKTGLQQPIAWIDEAGCCFFPEVCAASDEDSCNSCKPEQGVHIMYEPNEIKFHLAIDVNGVDGFKLRECSGESNALVKDAQFDTKQNDVEVEGSINAGEGIEKNQGTDLVAYTEAVYGKLDLDTVQKMFLEGMSNSGIIDSDIVEIYRCSGESLHARLELFHKQVGVTERIHGDANVQYAWLPSSKEELPTMMKNGLGYCGPSAFNSVYGFGIRLSAATYPYSSVPYCDVDENGVRHLVLCRVIIGNTELVRPGAGQLHPSGSEYDSGVDNIQCPKSYVVWNMNINTHIYPEFVVGFKVPLDAEGHLKKNNVSGDLLQSDSSTVDNGNAAGSSKEPKSPWLPFPLIFAAIRNKIPPNDMDTLRTHFTEYQRKQLSRNAFVMRMRLIVGDTLLRAVLTNLQIQRPPNPGPDDANRNQNQG